MRDESGVGRVDLPADRAFVVQFETRDAEGLCFHGRVEHLATGRAARFHSRAAFVEFLEEVLGDASAAASRLPPSSE